MEKQQLELLIKENSELKQQMELLKKEILILKNSSTKPEIRDFLDVSFETYQHIGLSLEISIGGIEDDGIHFMVGSSNSEIDYDGCFKISFIEINEWFIENDKTISSDNLNECLEELVSNEIDNLF